MWLSRPQIEAFEQPLELLHRERAGGLARIGRRPGEALGFEPLVPEAEAVAVPVQRLELVATAVDEQVQRVAERARGGGRLGERTAYASLCGAFRLRSCPLNASTRST